MIFDKGRVCIVRRGRDFGKLVYIVEKPKLKDFDLVVEGPKLKKGKKNVAHLWPVNSVVENTKELEKVKL